MTASEPLLQPPARLRVEALTRGQPNRLSHLRIYVPGFQVSLTGVLCTPETT